MEAPLGPLFDAAPDRPAPRDPSGSSVKSTRARFRLARTQIGLGKSSAEAQEWFVAFEKRNRANPSILVVLAEQLAARRARVEDYHVAMQECKSHNIIAVLHYLDYLIETGRSGVTRRQG